MNTLDSHFDLKDYGGAEAGAHYVFEEIKVPHDNPDLAPVVLKQRLRNLLTYLLGQKGVRYKVAALREDVYPGALGPMRLLEAVIVPDPDNTKPMSVMERMNYEWILKTRGRKSEES